MIFVFPELSFQCCGMADWILRNMRGVHHVEDATATGLKSLHECNNPPGAPWRSVGGTLFVFALSGGKYRFYRNTQSMKDSKGCPKARPFVKKQ